MLGRNVSARMLILAAIDVLLVLATLGMLYGVLRMTCGSLIGLRPSTCAVVIEGISEVALAVLYTLNQILGHSLWTVDSWGKESLKQQAAGKPGLSSPQIRCLLFMLSDIPLVVFTIWFVTAETRFLCGARELCTLGLIYSVLIDVLYTANNSALHVAWAADHWREESRKQQLSGHKNRLSPGQRLSLAFFLVPDALVMIPATLLFWKLTLSWSVAPCPESFAAALWMSMIVNIMYTFHSVLGHLLSFGFLRFCESEAHGK